MSASRVQASTRGGNKAAAGRREGPRAPGEGHRAPGEGHRAPGEGPRAPGEGHRAPGPSKVLAERNPEVVAVGAWVEGGQDFPEDPCALALLTEQLQVEKRREDEESLRRFQDDVRHRVAQRPHVFRWRQHTDPTVTPDQRTPHHHDRVWTRPASADERPTSAGAAARRRAAERSSEEPRGGMTQVRLRLAACRLIRHEEATSDLPGGRWNVSAVRHRDHVVREEEEEQEKEEEEEEEVEEEDECQHDCPLVQQKLSGRASCDADGSPPDPGLRSNLTASLVLWPLTNQDDLRRQRQSQFLIHRRRVMNTEREQVKENKQHRKHLRRTARIKAEKERVRVEEERRLQMDRQLEEARRKLEERELLVLEQLKLEEDEERAVQLLRRRRQEKGKVTARFMEAQRAQIKKRLSQMKLELPPLCCCASSFWDSHPDTCANNCIFHNNPKAYTRALHSAMLSLDLQ